MGYGKKIKDWFTDEIDDETVEDTYEEEYEEPKTSIFEQAHSRKTSEAVNAFNANKDSHLILFEPRAYSEASEIGTFLKQKRAAVVNLHRLQKEQSKRFIDFLTGVIFAIDGDIQQFGPKIFLCTPKNIGVSGNITLDNVDTDF